MAQLHRRDRDQTRRAVEAFLASAELAGEQLEHAAELLDTMPMLADDDPDIDKWLRRDIADAAASVRFFRQLFSERTGRRAPRELTKRLGSLAPRRRTCIAREWPAMVSVIWLRCAFESFAELQDDAATVAASTFYNLAELIESETGDLRCTAPQEAIREYLALSAAVV